MIGLGQLRAYKILSKSPRHLPWHSDNDAILFRTITWGAGAYLAVLWIAYFAVDRFLIEIEDDPFFPMIMLIAAVLLICWWTTDMVPRFARWSILTVVVPLSLLSILLLIVAPMWNKIELGALLVFLLVVATVASRQLVAMKKRASGKDDDERTVG